MYAVYMIKSYAQANVLTDYSRHIRRKGIGYYNGHLKRSDLGSYT